MNNKGFVSSALIYTFFILFLILMVFLLNDYSSTRYMVDRYRYDIKQELYEMTNKDLNLYIMVKEKNASDYKYVKELDSTKNYNFIVNESFCKDSINSKDKSTKSSVNYVDNNIVITSTGIAFCYAYFVEV